MAGSWIRQEKRQAIYSRDDFTCAYCGVDLSGTDPANVTLDHVTARANGGHNAATNLVTCCRSCNSAKQDMGLRKFIARVADATGQHPDDIARRVVNFRRRVLR